MSEQGEASVAEACSEELLDAQAAEIAEEILRLQAERKQEAQHSAIMTELAFLRRAVRFLLFQNQWVISTVSALSGDKKLSSPEVVAEMGKNRALGELVGYKYAKEAVRQHAGDDEKTEDFTCPFTGGNERKVFLLPEEIERYEWDLRRPFMLKQGDDGRCIYCGSDGACSIHGKRPLFCRAMQQKPKAEGAPGPDALTEASEEELRDGE